MKDPIIHIESLSQLHRMLGFDEPDHPLISLIDVSKFNTPEDLYGKRISSAFFTIMLKDADCGMIYGRNYFDFEEGMLTFIAPDQVVSSSRDTDSKTGWMLFFHPDLIRRSNLGKKIDQYRFFSYDVTEALHLSKKEEEIINDIVAKITYETEQNIDAHTEGLLSSQLEVLLNYCQRFYERQFHTRSPHHTDIVTRVEGLLRSYYKEEMQLNSGTPSIGYLAENVNLSSNYLSDLLKKETGKNAKDTINDFVVEKAKTLLLNSNENVSQLAYDLGFNYPHYFSRLFKQKTGKSPNEYRESQLN